MVVAMIIINSNSIISAYFAIFKRDITPDNGTCEISVVIIRAFERTASSKNEKNRQ